MTRSFVVIFSLVLASLSSFAGSGTGDTGSAGDKLNRIRCGRNDGPFGGGMLNLILKQVADKDVYDLSIILAKADGTNQRELEIGKGLECIFSKIDKNVALCKDTRDSVSTDPYRAYLKITKVTTTAISDFGDSTGSAYNLKIAAPNFSESQLNELLFYGASPTTLNTSNKSFDLSFAIDGTGLSACK